MLKFTILNGYRHGPDGGHKVQEFDTTLAEDVAAAEAEFNRLTGEGRVALVETEDGAAPVAEMPREGEVSFLLPVAGG